MELKKIDETVEGTDIHKRVCNDMLNLKFEFVNMINLMESSINGMLLTVKSSLLFNDFESTALENASKGFVTTLREIMENGCVDIKEFNLLVDKMNKYKADIAYWDEIFDARQAKEDKQKNTSKESKNPKM